MYFRLFAFAVLLTMVAACDSAPAPQATPTASDVPAPSPGPASPTAVAVPSVTPTAVAAARPADGSIPGVFLLDWAVPRPTTGGTFRPIEPATALDAAGFGPLDMLQAAQFYPSPDGKTLIAMVALSGSAPGSKLSTIDLVTWTMRDLAKFTSYPGGFAWTPDSRSVYFHQPGDGADYTRPDIARLDVAVGTIEVIGHLDFWLGSSLRLSADGSHLYFLGLYSSDPRADILKGDPFLAAFDIRTGKTEKLALPGMLMGQVRQPAPEGQWGSYRPGLAVAPDDSRAYIADAASDRLVVIDLRRMVISDDKSVAKRSPAWKRGLSWLGDQFVSSAHAKGGDYHTSTAQLSPDGLYLHVTGTASESCANRPEPCVVNRPAGLRVVDTKSLKVVLRAGGIGSAVLSPDGRWLIGFSKWWEEPADGERATFRGAGLQFFDTGTLKRVAQLNPGAPFDDVVFDPSGLYAIAISPGPGLPTAVRDKCSEPCNILSVVDLQAFKVAYSRHDFAIFAALFSTASHQP
jgi:DNA-binding beta-propeller fold protein YncE